MKLELTDHSETLRKQIIQDLDQKILWHTRLANNLHIEGNHYQANLNENIIKVLQRTKDVFQSKESNFHTDEKGVVYYK